MFPLDDGHSANEFCKLSVTGKARVSKTDLHIGTLQPRISVLITNDIGLRIQGSSKDAESNKVYYAGADYAITEDLTAQYYYANLENYYMQHFVGLVHDWS